MDAVICRLLLTLKAQDPEAYRRVVDEVRRATAGQPKSTETQGDAAPRRKS